QTFSVCIDTIIRQVDDIGNMISEFSAFARMPAPELQSHDLNAIVRRAVFLQRNAKADIDYEVDLPEGDLMMMCDDRQLGQALTNLLQNAADSIGTRLKSEPGVRGMIRVVV